MCFSADRDCATIIATSIQKHIIDGGGEDGPWTLPAGSFDILDGLDDDSTDDDDDHNNGDDEQDSSLHLLARRVLDDGYGPADYNEVMSALEDRIRSHCNIHQASSVPADKLGVTIGASDGRPREAVDGVRVPAVKDESVEHREVINYVWSEVFKSGSNVSFEIEVAIEVPIDALIDSGNVSVNFQERQFDVSIPTLPSKAAGASADRVVYHMRVSKLFRPVDVQRCYHKVSNRFGRVKIFLRKKESLPWRFLKA